MSLCPHIEIAETLNNNYINIIKELEIKVRKGLQCRVSNTENSVDKAIKKYQSYLSIEKIKKTSGDIFFCFSFRRYYF